MADDEFTETADIPAGRKSREISKKLWDVLEDSAKRGVAFSRVAGQEVIEELRKDLSTAGVKAKYVVTTASAKLENGQHKLTFAATHAEQAPPAPAPAAPAPGPQTAPEPPEATPQAARPAPATTGKSK